VQDLLNFTFVSDNLEDIKSGLQPFIIADGSAEHPQANLELSRLYGLLHSGDHCIMLADLELLKTKEVQSVPLNYFELERNLGMFGNLLGTVLGSQHTLTIHYRSFWTLLSQSYRNDIQQIIDTKHYIKPAHILRSIQLICYHWFSQKKHRVPPAPPEFTPILTQIILSTYSPPHLPPALYKLMMPKLPATPFHLNLTPSLTGSSQSSSSASSGSGSASSGSGVSALTTPTVPTPPGQVHPLPNSKIVNLNPDHALGRLEAVKLRNVIGSSTPPVLDDNTQICLSYHLRHSCWSNCRRAHAHGRTLSATERTRVEQYVRQQLATLAASHQSATQGSTQGPPQGAPTHPSSG